MNKTILALLLSVIIFKILVKGSNKCHFNIKELDWVKNMLEKLKTTKIFTNEFKNEIIEKIEKEVDKEMHKQQHHSHHHSNPYHGCCSSHKYSFAKVIIYVCLFAFLFKLIEQAL